jgi:hypothetical protein
MIIVVDLVYSGFTTVRRDTCIHQQRMLFKYVGNMLCKPLRIVDEFAV